MIRAFVTTWSNNSNHITNPIIDYIEANSPLGLDVVCSMHYPDADVNGLPDKSRCLVIAQQPTGATTPGGQTIEDFANLAGVYMLPAYQFSKPVSEISQTIKDDISTQLQNNGIPLTALSGIIVYGDFIRKVAKYFSGNHNGFGQHIEITADAEFA